VRQAPAEGAALARALAELLADEHGRRTAGATAAAHARTAFSWSRAADEHLELYGRALGSLR
ncbi:MAG: glycosyltransferase family 1 protein, partial [Thermoleophilaceae bacterium]